ncbi:MAG: class I SAM-dependent methyltransferase [Promethearchaeota archaeon]|jgi:SAM-dependent methyltransferase
MKNKELFDFLISEAEHPFSGWDFSYIDGRVVNGPLTWSYLSKIIPLIRCSESLLDMGTGGGEFLASLIPLPTYTCVTEGYEPNVSIAKKALEPLGVKVFSVNNKENLPFEDEAFDLIINRHEYYNPNEVFRTLKPDGIFITQQVGDQNDSKLRLALTGNSKLANEEIWNLDYATKELEKSSFEILERFEVITYTRIFDVGAIVYYLKAIPWELPSFSVKKYYNKLLEIHDYITKKRYLELEMNNHRFLIKSRKPRY